MMYYRVNSRMYSFSCTDPITSKISQKTSKIFSAEISEKYSYAFSGLLVVNLRCKMDGLHKDTTLTTLYSISGPPTFAVATPKVGTYLLRRRRDIFVLLNSDNLELLKRYKFTAGKQ